MLRMFIISWKVIFPLRDISVLKVKYIMKKKRMFEWPYCRTLQREISTFFERSDSFIRRKYIFVTKLSSRSKVFFFLTQFNASHVELWPLTLVLWFFLGTSKEAYTVNAGSSWVSKSFFFVISQVNTNSLKSTVPFPFVSNTENIRLEKHKKL